MPDLAMMQGSNQIDTAGEDTTASAGTTITANATANTKGNWTELIASTAAPADGVLVILGIPSGTVHDLLVDIGIGASTAEKVLITDILHSAKGSESAAAYYFPIKIPAGSRLSARMQSSTGGATVEVTLVLFDAGWRHSNGLSRVTAYGAASADSGGAGIDPGGTANTKGGWAEIVASTTNPIKQMLVVIGDRANNVMTNASFLLDIGVGAAASEKIVIPNLWFIASAGYDQLAPSVFGPFPVNIPAGSRLAANCQCSIIDATDRLIDVVIYGVD